MAEKMLKKPVPSHKNSGNGQTIEDCSNLPHFRPGLVNPSYPYLCPYS